MVENQPNHTVAVAIEKALKAFHYWNIDKHTPKLTGHGNRQRYIVKKKSLWRIRNMIFYNECLVCQNQKPTAFCMDISDAINL